MNAIYSVRASSDGFDAAIAQAIGCCRYVEPALARDLEALIGTERLTRKIARHDIEHECIAIALKILVYVAMEIDEGVSAPSWHASGISQARRMRVGRGVPSFIDPLARRKPGQGRVKARA